MADSKHLRVLSEGRDTWNSWRSEYPSLVPDLSGADLQGHHLDGVNFQQAYLEGTNFAGAHAEGSEFYSANLQRANLSEAYLADAKFSEANLTEANLEHANLYAANLSNTRLERATLRQAVLHDAVLIRANLAECNFQNADLGGANLSQANLTKANLRGASLQGANLTRAALEESYFDGVDLGGTLFTDTNLRHVFGLDTCTHSGPNPIDLQTLARSGELPLSFLRGCGLPDGLIDYLPSLLNKPFQFYSCFISYSVKDTAFAQRLYADLQNAGVRCWYAPEDMKIGDKIRDRIDQSIRVYDKLLIILSGNSITSSWVEKEVETAFEEERRRDTTVLFPVRLDDDVMETAQSWAADIRRTRHIGDFHDWKVHDSYGKSLKRLLRDLRGARALETPTINSDFDDDIPF